MTPKLNELLEKMEKLKAENNGNSEAAVDFYDACSNEMDTLLKIIRMQNEALYSIQTEEYWRNIDKIIKNTLIEIEAMLKETQT